jgi:Leucine-rich repeat (LRR) protein
VRLTPNLNDKSNPIYTLTKLQHLELNECEISELNETISKLVSFQTLLLSYNFELNRLPPSMTKLTSLLHLSLNNTKIQSNILISVVCQLPSLQVLEMDWTPQFETLSSQISQLTSLHHKNFPEKIQRESKFLEQKFILHSTLIFHFRSCCHKFYVFIRSLRQFF